MDSGKQKYSHFGWCEFESPWEEKSWFSKVHGFLNVQTVKFHLINKLIALSFCFRYLDAKNFLQIVKKPTHDGGGTIDHIYINQCLQEKKPFHSQRSVYYSDHDVLVLHVPISNVDN